MPLPVSILVGQTIVFVHEALAGVAPSSHGRRRRYRVGGGVTAGGGFSKKNWSNDGPLKAGAYFHPYGAME